MKLIAEEWQDYRLLDSGHGRKLEQFGPYRLIRPEPQARWQPSLPDAEWASAPGRFDGQRWRISQPLPDRWVIQYRDLPFWVRPSPSGHLGVFPEQAPHWVWLGEQLRALQRPVHLLNLFGYTGLASLFAAQAGAQVTHVDASRPTITWAKDNQVLAGLADRPVRWLVDDALKFVAREIRRGKTYDGFLLDPPPFGQGPKGEIWKIESSLPELLAGCRQLWSDAPALVVLTAYTTRLTLDDLREGVAGLVQGCAGPITAGSVGLLEDSAGHRIEPASFVRWSAG
jgi:23S rRNA (cytosine1962-C5)-methyltransferase